VKVDSVIPTPDASKAAVTSFPEEPHHAESRAVAALLAAGQTVTIVGDSLMVRGPRARAILSEHAARHGFTVTAARAAPPTGGPHAPAFAADRTLPTVDG